jgi:hypothetical protein
MFFVVKFNSALAAMNINPSMFPNDVRQRFQEFAKSRGLTPQEGALCMVAEAIGVGYEDERSLLNAIIIWRRDKKIFTNKPEVQQALMSLGFDW